MQYPLYDKLLAEVRCKEEKNIDMNKICTLINNLSLMDTEESTQHYEEIQAIIIHHDLVHNDGILLSLVPNEGKLMPGGKSILYTLIKLPNLLRQIIAQYIEFYS